MIQSHSEGAKAIAKILDQFNNPSSELFRMIRVSLLELEGNYSQIRESFLQRAASRKSQEEESKRKKRSKAHKSLQDARDLLDQFRESKQTALIPMAENSVKFAEGEIAIVENTSKLKLVLIEKQNGIDEQLWKWYDQLISLVVKGIEDDSKHKAALQFLSGGALLIGGLVGSAAVVGIAALLSAVQLTLSTVNNFKGHAFGDAKTWRLEKGLLLIGVANMLSISWLTTLTAEK